MPSVADIDPHTEWGALARHDVVVATVREFTELSGAERVAVLLDEGDGVTAALFECEPGAPLMLTEDDETYLIPVDAASETKALIMRPLRPIPSTAITVDPEDGQVVAPVGAVASLGLAVLELARVLGGRTVATADFATATGVPLTIAARDGEPLVMEIDGHQFVMADGWPVGEPDL